jgi:rubrerythrin
MAYKNMRDKMFQSAVNDMAKNLNETVSEMSKMSRIQPKMYARIRENPFPKNCYLCGTHDNVQVIEYGINTANIVQNILVCPTCRKWLGEFLLSDEIQKVADIIDSANEPTEEVTKEATEIVPTKAEEKEWKDYLYNSLWFLATERPEFYPEKSDSLDTLLESFFHWAKEYNDGYFTERDEADTDRYCAWLVQEYGKRYA